MSDRESKLPPHLRPPVWRQPKAGAGITYRDPTSEEAIGRAEKQRKRRRPLYGPDWKG